MDSFVLVRGVDHEHRLVSSYGRKATLNAQLLDFLFSEHPRVQSIVHYHQQEDGLLTLPYAPPGTVRDSLRQVDRSFNIEGHGAFILLDEFGVKR